MTTEARSTPFSTPLRMMRAVQPRKMRCQKTGVKLLVMKPTKKPSVAAAVLPPEKYPMFLEETKNGRN